MKNALFSLLLTTTFLSTSAMAVTLEPTLDGSAVSYSEGTSTDYNFTIDEADSEGNITTKYYKINLDENKFSTSSSISWTELDSKPEDMTNVVAVYLPNKTKYFQYSYQTPSGYTEQTSRVDHTNSIKNKVFKNFSSTSDGGAFYYVLKNLNIQADFINNSSTTKGGAIYHIVPIGGIVITSMGEENLGTSVKNAVNISIISNITGNFIGNYVYSADRKNVSGGAIKLDSGGVSGVGANITGDFVANYAFSEPSTDSGSSSSVVYGGAISMGYLDAANITGNFIGNYGKGNHISGGAIYSVASGVNIIGDFISNYAEGVGVKYSRPQAKGGAIYNEGDIENVSGDFIGNYVAKYQYTANNGSIAGGAIYNEGNIDIIKGEFIRNFAYETGAVGGAILNYDTIGDIEADFIGNYVGHSGYGGAVYNSGDIENITGDFINNHTSPTGSGYGGAIGNGTGTINNIVGDFIGNSAGYGGAIYNDSNGSQDTIIEKITGDFISNSAGTGGAIANRFEYAEIGEITGDFIGNSAGTGGAIYNYAEALIGDITGDFAENKASGQGGAIWNSTMYNYSNPSIGDIIGNFTGNNATTGGAIYNTGVIGDIVGDFIGNYALAQGGAIYTTANMTFASGNDVHFINDNYTKDATRGKIYNAIYSTATVTFDTTGGGAWVINDNLEGGNYVFLGNSTVDTELGTTTQYININNAIVNAANISVDNTTLRFGAYQHLGTSAKNYDGSGKIIASLNEDGTENFDADSVTSLALNNAVFDIANGYTETIKLKNYTANNSFVHLDVDVDNMVSDVLNMNGDVDGITNLIVHATSDRDIRGMGAILFAQSTNDTLGNSGSFVLHRVYGSPYMYDIKYTNLATNSNKWEFEMNNTPNSNTTTAPADPNPEAPAVEEEVVPPSGGDDTGGDNTGGDDTGGDNTGGDDTGGDDIGGGDDTGYDDDNNYDDYPENGGNNIGIGSSTGDSSLIINPTLDTIIKEGKKLTGDYELTALGTDELPEGAEKVIIDGTEYYFTPSGENADLLKNLAHTPALNLVESENGIFSFGGKKYSYDIAQIPESAFYYDGGNVVMKTNKIFLSDRIKPYSVETDGDNTFAISSYDGTVQYYKYVYDSTGRTTYKERTTTLADNTDADFRRITSAENGGAVNNAAILGSITGDFVQNKVEGADDFSGGAIYNDSEIGKIVGDFLENSVETSGENAEGGAIYNNSNIDEIRGSFVANHVDSISSAIGGAIVNNATIGNITGHFVGNYAKAETETTSDGGSLDINSLSATAAGALHNLGVIGDITGDFIGNYSSGGLSLSGAILNAGSINSITGDFIGNYSEGNLLGLPISLGGTMTNAGYIGSITGDFVDNHAGIGGAIGDLSFLLNLIGGTGAEVGIQSIKGDFINNSADYAGGAIASFGITKSIDGDFINNKVKSTSVGFGGAVATVLASDLKNINSNFKNNGVDAVTYANGGAFTNANIIDQFRLDETSDFINTVSNIKGSMTDNYAIASGDNGIALGGGIYSLSSINLTSDGKSQQISGNYTKDSTGKQYNAIFASNVYDLLVGLLSQDEETMSQIKMFTGLEEFKPIISVNTLNGGNWTINDSISGGVDGTLLTTIMTLIEGLAGEELGEIPVTIPTKTDYSAQYYLNFIGNDTVDSELGTTTQYINMNNAIVNAGKVNVENTTLRFGAYQHKDKSAKNWDAKGKFIAALNDDGSENLDADSVTSLTLHNAVFDIANGYMESVNLKNYSATDSFVHLDVDVENMVSDIINVKGDVDGITKLVIHASSDKDIRGQGKILFAESFGDTKGNEGSFEVARVYKSPYLYDVVYEGVENTTTETTSKDNTWFFEMNDEENPNKDKTPIPDTPVQPLGPIEVAPEVIATVAVKTAGLSQTNGMVYNIMRKVGVNRLFCPGCGFYDYNWDGEAFHNLWVDTTYNGLTIEAPVEIDAKVWGIEAGSDLQHDLNNKLGIFVSYRQGNYEMDGKGEKYYSNIGSEIDIDSYLAGLYYRYDYNDWYAFATVYGGMQNAEITTDDGVANYDTDGIEFGGSIEAGYNYALTRKLSVTPSLGAFYSQISYDDATDNVGKTVNYNDLKQVELEAGAKFAYTQYTDNGFYSLYVKPSVVQTLIDGDEINITEIGKVDTVEDKTLGRVELGGNIGFNENWSAYGWANYTFGSDYEATSLGLGLNYAW